MLEKIMTASPKSKKLIMEIVILKRNSILKGVHLLLISERLEFLFKTNSIGKNPQLSSLEVDIHSNKNIFTK